MNAVHFRRGPRALAGVLVAASLIGGAALWHGRSMAEDTPVPQTPQHQKEHGYAKSLSHAFRSAANATMPSVVTITSEVRSQRVRGNVPRDNPFKGTPFEDFFNNNNNGGVPFNFEAPERHRTGVGAGVIIDKSGLVLTNNHVVEGASEVTVRLADGREFKGTDIKTDKQSDLAIVHIKGASDLHAATLGNSDALEIGDWVIAVGNPFNQESTVSAGIISGKGRTLAGARAQFLQTDAAINPGNSGGPLVDLDGEVVGINTAIASNSGGFQGIGFAIPVNQAKWVVDQLTHGGSVKRAYLGVLVEEVSSDLAEQLGVRRHEGVVVTEVKPDTPAAKAGVHEGDIITDFSGKHVATRGQLQHLVERTPLNEKAAVSILRDGKPMTIQVAVQTMPDLPQAEPHDIRNSGKEKSSASFASNEFGFEVANLTPSLADQLGMQGVEGVIITDVSRDGLAAEHGLREGMVIKKVGSQPVKNVEEFQHAIASKTPQSGVMLLVRTPNGSDFIVLKE